LPSSNSPKKEAVGYYSLLRYLPDPVRDEAVNVGLFLVDKAGTWSRFDGDVPRGVLRGMRRADERTAIEAWIDRTKEAYVAAGPPPVLPGSGWIDVKMLQQWAHDFGGALRVTVPAIAVGDSMDQLWGDLFARLVSRTATRAVVPREKAASLPATAHDERVQVSGALVKEMRHWQNFDRERIRTEELFSGRKTRHQADVAIVNHVVTAVMKTLPVVHGSDQDVITARALLIDAAVDLDSEVVKLGLYDEPPPDRSSILVESRDLLTEFAVELVPRRDFGALEARFGSRFFS
jgi:hypothetical protein